MRRERRVILDFFVRNGVGESLYLYYVFTKNCQGHYTCWISNNNDGIHIQVKSLNGCPNHIQYRCCNIGYWFGIVGVWIDSKEIVEHGRYQFKPAKEEASFRIS